MCKVPTGRNITARGDVSVPKKPIQYPRTQHWDKWCSVTTALQERASCKIQSSDGKCEIVAST